MRSRPYLLFTAISLVVFILVTGVLRFGSSHQPFPGIAVGSYFGHISGLPESTQDEQLSIYFEKSASAPDKLFVAVLGDEWKPVIVNNSVQSPVENPAAIELKGPGGRFLLTAPRADNLEFEGEISNHEGARKGTWRVAAIVEEQPLKSEDEVAQFSAVLSLRASIHSIEERIKIAQISVTQQKAEIEKLERYLTEGEMLKRNADKKFEVARTELTELEAKLTAQRKISTELAEKLRLSQRLTGMGKLAALARESLERENRWVESMLRSNLSDASLDLDLAAERGERILKLKAEIAKEQDRIFRLAPAAVMPGNHTSEQQGGYEG